MLTGAHRAASCGRSARTWKHRGVRIPKSASSRASSSRTATSGSLCVYYDSSLSHALPCGAARLNSYLRPHCKLADELSGWLVCTSQSRAFGDAVCASELRDLKKIVFDTCYRKSYETAELQTWPTEENPDRHLSSVQRNCCVLRRVNAT